MYIESPARRLAFTSRYYADYSDAYERIFHLSVMRSRRARAHRGHIGLAAKHLKLRGVRASKGGAFRVVADFPPTAIYIRAVISAGCRCSCTPWPRRHMDRLLSAKICTWPSLVSEHFRNEISRENGRNCGVNVPLNGIFFFVGN